MDAFRKSQACLGFESAKATLEPHKPLSFEVEHMVGMSAFVSCCAEITEILDYQGVNEMNDLINSLPNLRAVYRYSNSVLAQYTYRAMMVNDQSMSLQDFYTTSFSVPNIQSAT